MQKATGFIDDAVAVACRTAQVPVGVIGQLLNLLIAILKQVNRHVIPVR